MTMRAKNPPMAIVRTAISKKGAAVEEGDQDEVPDRREGKKCHEGRVQVPVPRDCERQEQAEEDLEGEKQII
eukprot:CAMPEP_0179840954 /NCGR_PEP_ID=MMETSP0982-20121206/2225_1 /TAXON_ID=483367 /ORGANISM="non described non described, Strain CCMP 2436" /LENGTH=71 /DNA_ID=CAMNT_0021724907 /DNA_START=846 /DNA_END=1060 /DNA_ORIENTATION=+